VCVGCLGAYAVAYGLGDSRWRTSIGLTTLVAGLQLLLVLLLLHESPHWLTAHGFTRSAAKARAPPTAVATIEVVAAGSGAEEESPLICAGRRGALRHLGARQAARELWLARRPLAVALGVATAHAATAANTVFHTPTQPRARITRGSNGHTRERRGRQSVLRTAKRCSTTRGTCCSSPAWATPCSRHLRLGSPRLRGCWLRWR